MHFEENVSPMAMVLLTALKADQKDPQTSLSDKALARFILHCLKYANLLCRDAPVPQIQFRSVSSLEEIADRSHFPALFR